MIKLEVRLVDLEKTEHPCLGCEEKRSSITNRMFVSVLATDDEHRKRPIKLWLKVLHVDVLDGDVMYIGQLAADTFLDLERDDHVWFGPEHILEWSTQYP